jgi:uncharacterized integral membrane protein (TIGR00698 family)
LVAPSKQTWVGNLPGLLLCAALGSLAFYLGTLELFDKTLHLGALLLVILMGMAIGSAVRLPAFLNPGISTAQRPIMRLGVALLGFKLVLSELANLGGAALVVIVVSTLGALTFGWWLGKWFGLDHKLSLLLGVGSSICGASAIIAADSVLRGERKHVAASLGVITLFGTLGIIVYPIVGRFLGWDAFHYGLWSGASLHETAQVVAAGQALGDEALKTATVVKLARITLLAPVVFYLAWSLRKHHEEAGEAKVPLVPWFLVGFLACAVINSTHLLSEGATDLIKAAGLWVLCVGMAGVGLHTGFKDLKQAGFKVILVGAIQWIFLAIISLLLAELLIRPAG